MERLTSSRRVDTRSASRSQRSLFPLTFCVMCYHEILISVMHRVFTLTSIAASRLIAAPTIARRQGAILIRLVVSLMASSKVVVLARTSSMCQRVLFRERMWEEQQLVALTNGGNDFCIP